MSILTFGTVALDTLKTPFGRRKDVLVGSATYFSVGACFFSPVSVIAVVGEDFPEKHLEFLKKKGVDLKGITVVKGGSSFRWEGEYGWDFDNPKTIATHLNVLSGFNPKIPEAYKKKKFVFLANGDPEIQKRVLEQVSHPKLIACDTMNYWISNTRKSLLMLLKKVHLFFLNEGEARQLTGEGNIVKAARAIQKMGPKNIIIKKGEHGSLLFSGKSAFSTPAYLLETLYDPTGAGDAFAGGVIGYLAQEKKLDDVTLRKAIIRGTVMATFAVEDFSLGRLGSIAKKDIAKRLQEYKKLTCF